jgi:hypothetical protein
MAQNADRYSLGGFASGTYEMATGNPVPAWADATLQFTYGNLVNSLAFGGLRDATATGAGQAPTLVGRSMGAATTYGRRTSQLMSLNLAGRGGLPQALSQASRGAQEILGKLGTALSGGLRFGQQMTIGLGFTAGEALNCAGGQ